jgi:cell division protein FtsB
MSKARRSDPIGRVNSPRGGPRDPEQAARQARRRAARPRRRVFAALVVAIATVGLLVVGVFPTRTYLAQRAATSAAAAELDRLDAENARLERRIDRLLTPAEVERIAREQYGLVRPGEEAYAVLPPPAPPVDLLDVWPFVGVADELNR